MILQFPLYKPKRYAVYVDSTCVGVFLLKTDAEKVVKHLGKYGEKAVVQEAA